MNIPQYLCKVREVTLTPKELIDFELEVKERYNKAEIKAPVHLTSNTEEKLIEIFQYVHPEDWVFCSWRNHYQALLHGVPRSKVMQEVILGKSMSVNSTNPKFYASSIVGGTLPIALGAALALKNKNSPRRVWVFIGDMTFESGMFYEVYKYAKNFKLPMQFVVEDNNLSTNTPTDETWGGTKRDVPDDVIYYKYKNDYPHHGTGSWVLF